MNIQAQYKLPAEFSIYSAEAYAILMALTHIPTGCKNIVICSDSLSVLTSIQDIYNPTAQLNPFVIRIKTSLYNMKISDRNITFLWVKAHTVAMCTYEAEQARLERLMDETFDGEGLDDTDEEFINEELDVFETREEDSESEQDLSDREDLTEENSNKPYYLGKP
ncbi:hypothetical protein JTB14_031084 [Gonioctena quinquepunctata]|nr:hypothetical protein JTB14_031084 [Gonioctena quinquepunctata]